MTDENAEQTPPPTREQEIARKAAKLLKQGRPQLERLIARTRPQAELAGKQALQYVREHEDEIRAAGLKLAQTRLPGPIGMAMGALANNATPEKAPAAGVCPQCATENAAAAKFCNECGAPLAPQSESA